MNEFPLQRILEFVRTIPPFDTLSREELTALARQMEIAYYPRDGSLINKGDTSGCIKQLK